MEEAYKMWICVRKDANCTYYQSCIICWFAAHRTELFNHASLCTSW